MGSSGGHRPFTIHVPEDVLRDLREHLARPRWSDEIPGAGWRYGANLACLRGLCHYWRERYDWRAH
jgi:epoxide hydrolase